MLAVRNGDRAITAASRREHRWRRFKMRPWGKFLIALCLAALWVSLSAWLALAWVDSIADHAGTVLAWILVSLLALVPGFVVALMGASLAMDRQPPLLVQEPTTPVTVIVAAYNEEAGIGETVRKIVASDYRGQVRIIVADNNSTDRTAELAEQVAAETGADLRIIKEPTPGKSHALNAALQYVDTDLVITVDADTLLHPQALRRLISRMETGPGRVSAVAGTVLVRNSRTNLLTRMQEWDYWIGIAAVKRMQGMYSATLVAQGAFSVYRTEELLRVGGWPDAIGEDIVVTWRLMEDGSRVLFEPTAVAFTDAPAELNHYVKQRARWARGMFEGITAVPPWSQSRVLAKLVASIDFLIPLLDIGYALVWLPGLLLLLLGYPVLVGVWTLLVFPITFLMYGILRHYQSSRVFGQRGLRVRRNRIGYLAFILCYQALASTASIVGYLQFLFRRERVWR